MAKIEEDLKIAVKDAMAFLGYVYNHVSDAIANHDGRALEDARSELSNASNAIDDAMGLIDNLLAPEPTREDLE